MPADSALEENSATHFRWMDDIKILAESEDLCRALLGPVRETVEHLGLRLSAEKTSFFDNPVDAIARLRDQKLDSLGFWLKLDVSSTTRELHKAFDQSILRRADAEQFRYRYIIGALKHRNDAYAAVPLVEDQCSMNADPRLSADYMAKVGLKIPRVVDGLFRQLSYPANDSTEGLALHLARAMTHGEWGDPEGAVFEHIIRDDSRPAPLRCWAVRAHSHTCSWRQNRTMEAAQGERDPLVRRAMVTTLQKVRDGRSRRNFLEQIRTRFPELTWTARWLEAA